MLTAVEGWYRVGEAHRSELVNLGAQCEQFHVEIKSEERNGRGGGGSER